MPNNKGADPTEDRSPNQRLPLLLARLASLQGKAVPWHRFSMMSETSSGAPLSSLSLESQAIELWRARFPTGDIRRVNGKLVNGMGPALWIGTDPGAEHPVPGMLVIRGALSTGALSGIDAFGRPHEIPAELAQTGHLILLNTDEPEFSDRDDSRIATDGKSSRKRRTARQWFNHAVRKRWRVFSEGALATITVNVIALMTSFYTMQVYDRVVPTQGISTLWVLTIGVTIAIFLELVMRQIRNRLVERGCKAIDEELSSVFFGHALAIRMDQRPRTVGTFAAQIRHFELVRNFMTSTTLFIFADAPFALLFIAVIWFIAGPVAIVPLAFVPISLLAGFAFSRSIARLTESHMEESNRKNGLLIEAIDGIESVKASSAEWKMLNRWQQLTRTLARDEVAMKDITSLSTNLTQTIQQLSYVGLVAAGAFAIGEGKLTVGGLIACTIIAGRALSPMAQLAGIIVQWQQARSALKGLDAIMALPPDVVPGERRIVPDHCQGKLRMENASFGYSADQAVVSVEAFQAEPGERIAVLGAIGSGKSTFIKLLSGLYQPKEGRVLLDGVDMTHLSPDFVREHVGYLAQDVRLFQGTLRDNLALGLPSPTDEQILASAKITGLDKIIAAHPKGLGIEISEGGRGLSGGQRQLVGLTRMLLARPRIMLLDEPTASMDPRLEETIAEKVFGMRPRDTTLIVVTHKLTMLNHFTRIVVLDRGRIVADGPRDEIIQRMRAGAPQSPSPIKAVPQASAPAAPGKAPSAAASPSASSATA